MGSIAFNAVNLVAGVEQPFQEAGPAPARPAGIEDRAQWSADPVLMAKFEAVLHMLERIDPRLARAFALRVRAATEIPGQLVQLQVRVRARQVSIRVEFGGPGSAESNPIALDLDGDTAVRVSGLEDAWAGRTQVR